MANVSEAYLKLVEYARRSEARRDEIPSEEEAMSHWSGVGFSLGGVKYVAPMGEVAEILQVPRYTQVPGVESWVKGVANVRGRLLPVMDLMGFLNKASDFQAKRRRLLVIEQGELYSGLVVEEVLGMQHFPLSNYEEDPQEAEEIAKPFLQGAYYRDSGDVWYVFSLYKLAEDPRFMNVAS